MSYTDTFAYGNNIELTLIINKGRLVGKIDFDYRGTKFQKLKNICSYKYLNAILERPYSKPLVLSAIMM